MQHQYWVTKKSVLRKFGGKEDECIVSSDAELDAKLELFKSINDSCVHLQRVIDLYQERLCFMAQEENALGRYLKECGKNEKNQNAGQIMCTSGKALAYTGHQRLTVRPPLVRLHHEVDTFRCRAVSDTRSTVSEMEKARTEYRAALSWMKSASTQLDPDTGHGLDKFRKAQSYVKSTKVKFDRLTLACLQKVDLLAAARCNMFSHALVPYQNALSAFSMKAAETLTTAAGKLDNIQFCDLNLTTPELVVSPPQQQQQQDNNSTTDKDKNTFFNAEYSDDVSPNNECSTNKPENDDDDDESTTNVSNLLGEDFSVSSPPAAAAAEQSSPSKIDDSKPSSALLDLAWPSSNSDFLGGDFMPSKLMQNDDTFSFHENDDDKSNKQIDNNSKSNINVSKQSETNKTQMSWLSLFAELDPLANPDQMENNLVDRA